MKCTFSMNYILIIIIIKEMLCKQESQILTESFLGWEKKRVHSTTNSVNQPFPYFGSV